MHLKSRRPLVAAALVTVIAAGLLATAVYTDRSAFCRSCHEMVPYHDAWAEGTHSEVECIACHVDAGLAARLAHKWVALKEVRAHFAGDILFPRRVPPAIPSKRCIVCHDAVTVQDSTVFDHALHAGRGTCAQCHFEVGHRVTEDALRRAGVFAEGVEPERLRTEKVTVDRAGMNLSGHSAVSCARCHDLVETACSACHEAPAAEHPVVGSKECTACHGKADWVFRHPATGKCGECHDTPKAKHPAGADCAGCHPAVGRDWRFVHPSGRRCPNCHDAPRREHPSSTACVVCHPSVGRSWAFRHPGLRSRCASCHDAPGGRHPDSTACARCHRLVGRSWSFAHPRVNEEHSSRSFACAKCHPRSYARVSCTCHGGGSEQDD